MASETTYLVSGMTCNHCAATVSDGLAGLDGVREVDVRLSPGGESRVRVISDAELVLADVRDAVDGAGYALTGVEAG